MNREYRPTSALLRSLFVACAATMTAVTVFLIGVLASSAGTVGTHAAAAVVSMVARG